jgi:hypothetical protein
MAGNIKIALLRASRVLLAGLPSLGFEHGERDGEQFVRM